jgi:D-beta-D-heptose 7-phosphate kinase/D-beta-D-heptose 1-phosphate adenosyltransferase
MGKVVDTDSITGIIEQLKQKGLKIVFTNGCFDIIHAGHVRYLREARSYGDILFVGLNSDRSIRSIKIDRPIVPEQGRAEVLSALDMVDYVIIFDQETPFDLIKSIGPDVLVKGGDWKREEIVGSDIVKEVHSLRYHEGLSTTDIIKKIKSK